MSNRVTIIGEAGVNHNGSVEVALKLVDAARKCGADVVKFQTYLPDAILHPDDPERAKLTALALPLRDFTTISRHCDQVGIEFCSTPECPETLKFLINETSIKRIKIGSGDLTNLPLLEAVAKITHPILLSTGMATLGDIKGVLYVIGGRHNITLLHCVSCYPCAVEDANLNCIDTLGHFARGRGLDGVGYSDHTVGNIAPLLAVAKGVRVIEKHFTLDNTLEGPDHFMSSNPTVFRQMVALIRKAEPYLGSGQKRPCERELGKIGMYRKGADGKRGLVAA